MLKQNRKMYMRLPLSSIDAKKPIIPIKPTAASANKAPQNREKTDNGKI